MNRLEFLKKLMLLVGIVICASVAGIGYTFGADAITVPNALTMCLFLLFYFVGFNVIKSAITFEQKLKVMQRHAAGIINCMHADFTTVDDYETLVRMHTFYRHKTEAFEEDFKVLFGTLEYEYVNKQVVYLRETRKAMFEKNRKRIMKKK